MAEVVGVIASIIEVVGLAKSVAASLRDFAKTTSSLGSRIKRLADHIDTSSILFERVRGALEEDAKTGRPMKDLFREDVLRCTTNSENVLRELQEAASHTGGTGSTASGAKALLRYSLLNDEVELARLRAELSESQMMLHLMLTIHWRPNQESVNRRRLGVIIASDLQSLRQPQIPGVAETVNHFIRDVSKLIEEHGGSENDFFTSQPPVLEVTHPTLQRITASEQSGSSEHNHSESARNPENPALNDAAESSAWRNHFPARMLWHAVPIQETNSLWEFQQASCTSYYLAQFVSCNRGTLARDLGGLDSPTRVALLSHLEHLKQRLLAIQARWQPWQRFWSMGAPISLDVATCETNDAENPEDINPILSALVRHVARRVNPRGESWLHAVARAPISCGNKRTRKGNAMQETLRKYRADSEEITREQKLAGIVAHQLQSRWDV